MNRTLYKETQTFRQPWMWLIIFLATATTAIFFAIHSAMEKMIKEGLKLRCFFI